MQANPINHTNAPYTINPTNPTSHYTPNSNVIPFKPHLLSKQMHELALNLYIASHSTPSTSPSITPSKPHSPHPRKGMKQEVYPFKEDWQLQAMQTYFLQKAISSPPARRIQAYRNWLFYTLGINMGFRGGDTCSLKWSDILTPTYEVRNDLYNYLAEQKTGHHRQLVFNSDVRKAVEFFIKAVNFTPNLDSYVFQSQHSPHMTAKSFLPILKKAAKECGITDNVGTHSLRKTFGYRYYKATGDLTALQYIFGHSSSLITLRYIGITAETNVEAYSKVTGTLLPDLEKYLVPEC